MSESTLHKLKEEYSQKYSIVENIYVYNVSMHNTTVSTVLVINLTHKLIINRTAPASRFGPTRRPRLAAISKEVVEAAKSRTSHMTL